jgi:hypothetical protein
MTRKHSILVAAIAAIVVGNGAISAHADSGVHAKFVSPSERQLQNGNDWGTLTSLAKFVSPSERQLQNGNDWGTPDASGRLRVF